MNLSNSRRQWRTGKPDTLQSMGSQRVDREAWHIAVHGVTKSRTLISNWPTATTGGSEFERSQCDDKAEVSGDREKRWSWKWSEGAMSQRMQAACRNGEGKKIASFWDLPACTLSLAPWDTILDLWSPELWEINLCGFQPLSCDNLLQ